MKTAQLSDKYSHTLDNPKAKQFIEKMEKEGRTISTLKTDMQELIKVSRSEFQKYINKYPYESKQYIKEEFESGTMKYIDTKINEVIAAMDFTSNLNEIQYFVKEVPSK